ncbi:MAG: 30S ribosomal protein S6--L-glutamate ligase [Rhodospirillales bacterium]
MSTEDPIVIGWEEWVSLPELGLPAIKAKADTGARTSSLHAFSVEPFSTGGKKMVRFGIRPVTEKPAIELFCTAELIGQREITSSNGESELRPIIRTKVRVAGEEWPIEISLTNREGMSYRMLLGRAAMKGRMIVNPLASYVHGEMSPDIYDDHRPEADPSPSLKIGILSREPGSYTTQRMVEVAEQRGHMVDVINTTRCYMNITSRKPEVLIGGHSLEGFDAIIPRIGSSVTFYGMAVVRQFELMGVYCVNGAQAIGRSRDKLYAHQLLAQAGVGMPATGMAHSPDDTLDLIQKVGGPPLVVKLLEGTQGKGVVLTETRKAAESVIGAFRGLKANILVQEFIKESGGADVRCFVIGNKVVAAMRRQGAEDDFRSNLHRGGKGEKIKITREERATAVKAARTLGLNVAGVDLLQSTSGPKVLEVNSSPGLEGIEKVTGKDIAGAVIDYVEANAHAKPTARRRRQSRRAT